MLNIAFRVDGGRDIGLGHIVRCLALADKFKETCECKIAFISKTPFVVKQLSGKNYYKIEPRMPESVDVAVVDLPTISEEHLLRLKERAKLLISIDDNTTDFKFCSDILIRPNISQKVDHFYPDSTTYLCGKNYVILRKQFENLAGKLRKIYRNPRSILLCFGGSDPNNLTQRLIQILSRINLDHKPQVNVIVGASFDKVSEIEQITSDQDRYSLYKNAPNMAELLWESDLAVISGGTLVYEACALGTPAIVISQNQKQESEAEILSCEGAIVNVGLHNEIEDLKIGETIEIVVSNRELRARLSKKARKLIDPYGVERITRIIMEKFERRFNT